MSSLIMRSIECSRIFVRAPFGSCLPVFSRFSGFLPSKLTYVFSTFTPQASNVRVITTLTRALASPNLLHTEEGHNLKAIPSQLSHTCHRSFRVPHELNMQLDFVPNPHSSGFRKPNSFLPTSGHTSIGNTRGYIYHRDEDHVIRQGKASDVDAIVDILRHPIATGSVLPFSRHQVEHSISNFFIYEDLSIAGKSTIAGISCIKIFPTQDRWNQELVYAAEFSKICTVEGFQGRGIARKLVSTMSGIVAKFNHSNPAIRSMAQYHHRVTAGASNSFHGKRISHVFALSNQPAMCHIFRKVGFMGVGRSFLCDEWANQYDMERDSMAFLLSIGPR
eukprot:Sdes_comp20419_c0_seq1m14472